MSHRDALTGSVLAGVFVASGPFDRRVEEAWGETELGKLIAAFINTRMAVARSNQRELAQRRLARSSARRSSTRDMAYRVASEVRHLTAYHGECLVFRFRRFPTPFSLAQVARLAGPTSKGKGQAAHSDQPGPLVIPWGDDLPASVLLSPPVIVSVTSEQGDDAPTWELTKYEPPGKAVGTVGPEVATVIGYLNARFDTDKTLSGQTRLFVPVASRGRTLGLLALSSAEQNAFSVDEVSNVEAFAQYLEPFMSRDIALDRELNDLAREASLQQEPNLESSTFPADQNLRGVLRLIGERLRRHLAAEHVVILRYDYRVDQFDPGFCVVAGGRNHATSEFLGNAEATARQVLERGRLEWHITTGDATAKEFATSIGIRSFYAKVLEAEKVAPGQASSTHPVGAIFVTYSSLRSQADLNPANRPRFSRADTAVIDAFASLAATHLARAEQLATKQRADRLVESIYRALSQAELANEEGPAVAHTTILRSIMDGALKVVQGTAGVLAIPCPEHNDLVFTQYRNLSDPTRHVPYGIHGGVTGQCAQTQRPIVVADRTRSENAPPGIEPLPFVPESKSEIAVPLLSGSGHDKRLVGVLDIESQVTQNAFGTLDQEILERLARAAVISLELASQIQQLKSLNTAGGEIDNADTPREVFEVLLPQAMATTGAYAASARTIDFTDKYLVDVLHLGEPGDYSGSRIDKRKGVGGWVYSHRRHCSISDLLDSRAISAKYPGLVPINARLASRSELCVPIQWRGDRIGVINLEHVQVGALEPYIDYMKTLASEAAYVLYQQRRRQREHRQHDQELVTSIRTFSSALAHDVKKVFARIARTAAEGRALASGAEVERLLTELHQQAVAGRQEADALLGHAIDPAARRELVDIRRIIEGAVGDLQSTYGRMVSIRSSGMPDQPVLVLCKAPELSWIVRQILDNAASHGRVLAPRKSLPIHVSINLDSNGMVVLAITGPGYPLSDGELDDMFKWEKSVLTPKGSGKSLPLARSIIGALGGVMNASRAADGTTVTLWLPVEERDPPVDERDVPR
jgi:GAF domain-containing protein